jgi:MerR-like DNA binding protein
MLSLVLVETVLTVSEVSRVLRALEGRFALTPRGIRYYARSGMVAPSGRLRAGKRARATRLYTVEDVALLRLVCRLHRQRVHERAVWGLVVYRGEELRRLIRAGEGVLAVDTPAALAITAEDPTTPKPIRVDIATLVAGLEQRLVAYRRRNPDVWTGLAWVPAHEAVREVQP